ncbi:hypothetical protein ON010_g18404 [Phytophthora cinnamomi]|nr:hypothetical protein ON010_g18404 [Phytophthora cinnamomi]
MQSRASPGTALDFARPLSKQQPDSLYNLAPALAKRERATAASLWSWYPNESSWEETVKFWRSRCRRRRRDFASEDDGTADGERDPPATGGDTQARGDDAAADGGGEAQQEAGATTAGDDDDDQEEMAEEGEIA